MFHTKLFFIPRCQSEAPTCTWKPSKEEENMDATKLGIAPALSELNNEKRNTINMSMDIAHSSSDHATRTSLSLSQMMLLPEDEDYSKEDHQYASLTKDLDAMVNLSVDEGESKTAVNMYTYFCICAH